MKRQRGEGKVGCLVSLLLLGILGAAAFKAVPIYYGNSELVDACEFIASGASRKPVDVLEREVKEKARALGVTELLADKTALRITKSGGGEVGSCTITLRYVQVIDFYGVYQWPLTTEKRITKPIFENIN
ncbi:MAG: hypothetical protein WCL47_03755 [Holophagaceae bacterium]